MEAIKWYSNQEENGEKDEKDRKGLDFSLLF